MGIGLVNWWRQHLDDVWLNWGDLVCLLVGQGWVENVALPRLRLVV